RCALRMLLEVLAVARIAGQDDRASLVVDAIAVGRLDQSAVVDFKRGDPYAVLVVDDAVACIFGRRDRYAFHGIFLVRVADTNIVGIGALEILHQRHGALRPDDAERALPIAVVAADPT